mmetsp:Transcript_27002/g.62344  ORF Transcript_27002/g.62344 Transcript_27002/m.62344 type:complete len:226 (+) Transcript_27002:717-1394(+)
MWCSLRLWHQVAAGCERCLERQQRLCEHSGTPAQTSELVAASKWQMGGRVKGLWPPCLRWSRGVGSSSALCPESLGAVEPAHLQFALPLDPGVDLFHLHEGHSANGAHEQPLQVFGWDQHRLSTALEARNHEAMNQRAKPSAQPHPGRMSSCCLWWGLVHPQHRRHWYLQHQQRGQQFPTLMPCWNYEGLSPPCRAPAAGFRTPSLPLCLAGTPGKTGSSAQAKI